MRHIFGPQNIKGESNLNNGSVAVSDRGYLFIVLGKYFNKTSKEEGTLGIGFNGITIKTPNYTIIAKNLNEWLEKQKETIEIKKEF